MEDQPEHPKPRTINVNVGNGDSAVLSDKGSHHYNNNHNNKAVHWLRWTLVFVLVASAVAVAVVVYFYTSGKEQDELQVQFNSDADKLLASVGNNFVMTMGAADDFMHRVIYHTRAANATWPFVPPLEGLAVQASKLMSLTNSIYLAFYPLIQADQREAWENFTRSNDGWVEEALRVQASDPNFHGPILEDYEKSYAIWRNEGPEPQDAPGPFLPSWMGSPGKSTSK